MESGAKPAQTEEAAKAPESDFDRLKAKHHKVRQTRDPLVLDIPGYDGELVAKYRVMAISEIQELSAKVAEAEAKDPDFLLHGAMDNIAKACAGIFLRSSDGSLVPLNDYDREKYGDEPVGYDWRLADFFGSEAQSAREIIADRFPEDLAIIDHSIRINSWMGGSVQEIAQGF